MLGKVLHRVWAITGGLCGKYLAVSIAHSAVDIVGFTVPGILAAVDLI